MEVNTEINLDVIKNKFGNYSSWAVWNYKDEMDISVIEKSLLHSNYVIVGLNLSSPVDVWCNFRGGKHDRKIKYAFNSVKHIKGAYMTDLIKKVEVKSKNILDDVKSGLINIDQHVFNFNEEMKTLKINSKTKFIIFGDIAREIYDNYYEKHYPDTKVFYLKHYSGRGTDKEWVEYVWNRLGIDMKFENEIDKYKI